MIDEVYGKGGICYAGKGQGVLISSEILLIGCNNSGSVSHPNDTPRQDHRNEENNNSNHKSEV